MQKASAAFDEGDYEEVEAFCGELLKRDPNSPDAVKMLIRSAFEQTRYSTATLYASKLVQMCPEDPASYNRLASVLLMRGRHEAAGAALREALRLDPDRQLALDNYAHVLQAEGRWDEAAEILESLVGSDPYKPNVWFSYAHSRHFPADASPRQDLEKVIRKGKFNLREQGHLHFSLAKLHKDAGDVDQAFAAFEKGNELRARSIQKQVDGVRAGLVLRTVGAREQVFTQEWKGQLDGPEVSPRPLSVILGAPRSGKSLLEGALSVHSRVRHYGELGGVQELLAELPKEVRSRYPLLMRELGSEALGRLRARMDSIWGEAVDEQVGAYVLTNPSNVFHVGTLMALNPDTRIVFCERDPVDNAMAIYMRWFSRTLPYAWAMDTIAEYIMAYRRLVDHWAALFPDRVERVLYEEYLQAPDTHAARILRFHGLDWESACADSAGESVEPARVGMAGSSGRRSRVNPAFARIGDEFAAYRPAFERAVEEARERVLEYSPQKSRNVRVTVGGTARQSER
ncbi:sulfotransferase [Thioalkalivibrio sp. ALgr3]|uniref:tetratricopeptide repeat-containing sulfotransferase family protein n=1 Tax=Thioalkalivibrio sp. ALgr3 TaxID=1239292 RepID=UPI000375CA3B|nr:sulfotransferase [Thioalkalivibrio sp. ALgr3]